MAEEESMSSLFERNRSPIIAFDRETLRIVKVNDAAVSQYGYSKEEFLDMKLIDIHPPTTVPDLVERCALPGKDCKLDPIRAGHSKHRRKDGTFIDVDIVCYPIPFEGRETIFMLLTDIQQRAREKQFV